MCFSTFRKPLLTGLNRVWSHIEQYNASNHFVADAPHTCRVEALRFSGCLPLARLDFRLDMHELVTCDASTTGGGACGSRGLTSYGEAVAQAALRGELAENLNGLSILSIGLFDGIAALRVALDLVRAQVLGHISVEALESAHRVVELRFPGSLFVPSVADVTEVFSQCDLVLLGAGRPCQGVSGLRPKRRSFGHRSSLFPHVPRIRALLQQDSMVPSARPHGKCSVYGRN